MADTSRQHAHELIDRMAPRQVSAVVNLLETMLETGLGRLRPEDDPVSRAIANAPIDDEPETEDERRAVAASKAWMGQHPGEGISHEDILAEFGLASDDLKR